MRARLAMRVARMSAAGFLAGLFLLLGTAQADDARSLRREARSLSAANERIAARSEGVLLDLYALETRVVQAQERVAALEARAAELERRETGARADLRLVRASLREAEARLGERLRQLYIEGGHDPLTILLGAESLEEAIAALDGFGRLERADRELVAQVKEARGSVQSALATIAARKAEVDTLLDEAEAARAALVRARVERASYLAHLAQERRMNATAIARLTARAVAAESRAERIRSAALPASAPASSPAGAGVPVSPPAVEIVPDDGSPGQDRGRLTVLATGYSLQGATATGVPAGWGVVAVDPAVIPLGTHMTIPGYGEGVAADTGGSVRGAVIDLWFPTERRALAWGTRRVTITLH
ncbi:MAG: 3D domain-containing protein [Actinomycetota bacterium]|nr:3D domain-containing protein [Actinomycetota bacterium]